MTQAQKKTVFILLGIIGAVAILYYSGLYTYFSLEGIKEKQQYFYQYVQEHYMRSVLVFISLFSLLLTVGLPVQPPFTLIGGYIFGFLPGVLFSLSSCVIGSMLSFFLLRTIFKPWVASYGKRFEAFKDRVKKDGASYLLSLHFLSILPYFMINLVAALADMPYITVFWVTLLGSVPLIVVYSLAAHELATICSARDIFSPGVIIALILLALCALLPMLIKRIKKDPNL